MVKIQNFLQKIVIYKIYSLEKQKMEYNDNEVYNHLGVGFFLTSSMRHPKQKSHLDGSKSDLIARCFSVRKSVFVK